MSETSSVTPVMRLEFLAAKLTLGLMRRLGPARASDFGGRLCRTIGPLLPVSRVADDNLRLAMPELDRAARRRIVRGVWENLGRTVGEFPHIGALRKDTPSGPGWEMVGEDILHAQAKRGGPAIFVSGHIGNWEMLPAAVAHYGMKFSSLYRAAGNPLVDRLIRDLRKEAIGSEIPLFAKGAKGARGALTHLAKGGALGLLVDQKMNDGVEARFFGHPAMTAPALAVMALRYRVTVIPGHVERIGPARFRLICEPPLVLPDSGDKQQDEAALTQTVNDLLERWIREKPESWLWLHRRWPRGLVEGSGQNGQQDWRIP
jgi:Kdo2-lipid IVA lauroyltransferase/acyltransferase